ncbi:MAG: glycosyltransferase [Thermoplasmata archaeon]
MGCSVIVCTDGRKPDLLRKCIDSLSRQTYQDLEVICVSSVSSLPPEIADKCRVIVEKRKGVSLAKNIGIRESVHDKIALTDDDCVCDPDWVENLTSGFEDKRVGCVTGGSLPTREGLWYASTRWEAERKVFGKGGGFTPPWLMGAGNNICLRKEAVVKIGLFDENLGPGTRFRGAEDIDVFHRMIESGYHVVYTPKAIVHHEPLDTHDQLKRMMSGYRIGLGAFFAKNRSSKDVRRYFFKEVLRSHLRNSRNNLLGGDADMGYLYFIGFIGALRGYLGYVLAQ